MLELPSFKKLKVIKTFGNSMLPLLYDRDVIYLKKKEFGKILLNDIVTVKKYNKIFTHRVIYKTLNYIITAGDNNNKSDGRIYSKNIIGIVYKVKRNTHFFNIDDLYLIQSSIYFKEIVKVKKVLEKNKIETVFLKGLPLHLHFEGAHPKRIYADCDLLIKKTHKKKADYVLRKLGYRRENLKDYKSLQKFLGADNKEISYYRLVNGFLVVFDVHFETVFFTHKSKIPFSYLQGISDNFNNEAYRQLQRVRVVGEEFTILKNELLIIYLLLHFYAHNFSGVYRLEFIKNIISHLNKNKAINWENLILKAKSLKIINFIIPGIYLLDKYYSLKLPYKVLLDKYPVKTNYSLVIFKLLCGGDFIFQEGGVGYAARINRALFMILLSEENAFGKIISLFQPRFILHTIHFFKKFSPKEVNFNRGKI